MHTIYTDKTYDVEDRIRFINYLSYKVFDLKNKLGEIKGWDFLYKKGIALIPKKTTFDFFDKINIKRAVKNLKMDFLEHYFYLIFVEEPSLSLIDVGLKSNKEKITVLTKRLDLVHFKDVTAYLEDPKIQFVNSDSIFDFNKVVLNYLRCIQDNPVKSHKKSELTSLITMYELGTSIFEN